MPNMVGVRFKRAGRLYYFDPSGIEVKVGENVVVETAQGIEIGWVVIAPGQVLVSEITEPLKPVIRKATAEDFQKREQLRAKADEALALCKKLVLQMGLDMKPIEAQHSLEGDKISVIFSAEERIDFRQLVKELSATLQARVQLRQVGPRDEAKSLGGPGRCGLGVCCSVWLGDFSPVTIKMAKEQDLPLSPPNLAGQCGRLRCCLRFEFEQYREARKGLPKSGTRVATSHGEATVVSGHPLKQTVTVSLESGAYVEFPLTEVRITEPRPRPVARQGGPGKKENESATPRKPHPEPKRDNSQKPG